MNTHKIFNLIMALIFGVSLLGMPVSVSAQEPAPYFFVDFAGDHVYAFQWPVGAMVTITIDDPTTQDTDFTETKPVRTDNPWSSETWIDFQSTIPFSTGLIVTMTDGITTKTHTVTDLTITGANAETDTVSGTAAPGALVRVWIHYPVCCIMRHVIADANGNWVADYSVPGDEGFETEVFDLLPNASGQASQPDNDSDATNKPWRVPNPLFGASLTENDVHGYEWPLGSSVTLAIDDPANGVGTDYSSTQTVVVADWDPNQTFVQFQLGNFVLQPGQLITMSQGTTTKTHTVKNLTVTAVDPVADTVSGTADPGAEIHIGHICNENGCAFRRVFADANGNWVADFSMPGEDSDEPDLFDIRPGTGSEARQPDEDGDTTNVDWRVPNPSFAARANDNRLEGWEWPLGATVTIEIDDPATPQNPDYSDSATVGVADWDPNQTWFNFDLNPYDLKVGDVVTVSDGITTKQHTVINLSIDSFDLDADTVHGTAEPNQTVNVWTCWQGNPCINRDETADQDGNWVTNFAVPGEQDWEQETADLRVGSWIDSSVNDDDGDSTMFGLTVLTPQQATEGVMDSLQEIVNANPGTPLADKVEDAIAQLQTALDELNKTPPDNQAAVGNLEAAVGELEAAVQDGLLDPDQGTQLMDQLAATARVLAVDAIDLAIAEGGDSQKITEAQQALAAGDVLRASGEFKEAVNKYKDALSKAESALP